MKPVIFRGEFNRISRIVKFGVNWLAKPDIWQMDTTQDLEKWEEGINGVDSEKKFILTDEVKDGAG